MGRKETTALNIFVLNAGSSSLKFGFYRIDENAGARQTLLARGIVEAIGSENAKIRIQSPEGREPIPIGASTVRQASQELLSLAKSGRLTDNAQDAVKDRVSCSVVRDPFDESHETRDTRHETRITIDAVGCRVVHGGARFTEPARITPAVLEEIRALASLAPLHNPVDADVIETTMACLPNVPTVAVFDTAFHHTLPEVAFTYGLPWELCEQHHLRRYGFHGISHRYVSERLLECLGGDAAGTRLITCHLGNGSSICALRDGRSVDTSMGLTPLEGLVMGTRSGDVDPGLLLYLLRTANRNGQELDDLLNHKSGLLGVSGRSGDVRDLEQAASGGDSRAELALELFAYRASKYIGAYAVALEGLDAVAFTGGIGEHSANMRTRICRRLAFMGIHLNEAFNQSANSGKPARISEDDAPVQAWTIPTDEEGQIARESFALLSASAP